MKTRIGLALFLALALGACSTSDNNDPVKDVTPGPADVVSADDVVADVGAPDSAPETVVGPPPYSFVTYNVGLAYNFVPLANERLPLLLEAVPTIDADFVCLQEVWEPADVEAFQQATAQAFPYQLYVDTTATDEETSPACTQEETDPLLACVNTNCPDTDDLTGCVMDNCVPEFTAVTQNCSNCLVANIAKPVDDIIETCLNSSASFLSEGRNGVMLLSRHEFAATDHVVLDSFIVRRVGLHARLELETGPLNVVCTHLSAALSEVAYAGEFDSWEDEQAAQIDQLTKYADEQSGEEPLVLLGDMNCGPAAGTDIVADLLDNFALFEAAGYTQVYLDQDDIECSWCSDNGLTGSETDRLIDQIFVKNLGDYADQLVVERIMDEPITVTHPDDGNDVETYLSDHFGMRASLP